MKVGKAIFLFATLLSGCASITTPTGGPKDETPPELVESNPANGQKNFKGKSIELTFNEALKLKDPKEEILITPSPGKNNTYTVKKNKVIIEPENRWEENTTYSINFREGIQDITEGNPADNLRIAFSTGATIDSLSIEGTVGLAFSEKIPEKITVALYQSDTFNIFNHTPTYFTKINKEGFFSIQNLKGGEYYIYAFDDKNKNLKVESKTEKFGFLSTPISLTENKDSLKLDLMMVDVRPPAITSIRHTSETTLVRINKSVDSIKIELDKLKSLPTFGDKPSELIFYHAFIDYDSIKVKLFILDSAQQALDTTFYLKRTETKVPKEGFNLKEISSAYHLETKKLNHQISFNKPIAQINFDSIYLKIDSLTTIKVTQNDLLHDTLHHTLSFLIKIEAPQEDGTERTKKKQKPFLRIGHGAIISYQADSSKSITKEIAFIKEEDTGLLTAKIDTKEKNFIVQVLTTNDILVSEVKNLKEFSIKYLKPETYKVRIIIDSNGNGKWDAGNFLRKIEPEKILFFKSDENKYTFPIRANWEYGPLVIKF
ncbi:MAG: Ig-like domain-containing protein [Cyclobacteriaceae bacterium]|nr:Ig-like domain-containing protein [Cyclobacteriaceae bacterium]